MRAAAEWLRKRLPVEPRVAVVLGSGLSHLADLVDDAVGVSFDDVPGLPPSTVPGHAGRFVGGRLGGVGVLLQAGRYHAYEGCPMPTVVAPVRIFALLGVEMVVITNAAGGIRPTAEPGDLILLDDHLNLMSRAPLAGPVLEGEQRFPDMSEPYDAELQRLARETAAERGVPLTRGTYAAVLGPSFETAAEIRMLGNLGADVVGMSTVPEVITARALGLRCVAISMVTNKGTGLSAAPLSHEEVLETGRHAGQKLGLVIVGLLERIAQSASAPGASTGTK